MQSSLRLSLNKRHSNQVQGNEENKTNHDHNKIYWLLTFHLETALFHWMDLLMGILSASKGMALRKFETAPRMEQVADIQNQSVTQRYQLMLKTIVAVYDKHEI